MADTLAEAYQRAFECDPRSAFGGIVALNRVVDDATVVEMVAAAQADLVIAPGYAPGVIEQLQAKRKNTRLLEGPAPAAPALMTILLLRDRSARRSLRQRADRLLDCWKMLPQYSANRAKIDNLHVSSANVPLKVLYNVSQMLQPKRRPQLQ